MPESTCIRLTSSGCRPYQPGHQTKRLQALPDLTYRAIRSSGCRHSETRLSPVIHPSFTLQLLRANKCVCVSVRARVRVCVRVCVCARQAPAKRRQHVAAAAGAAHSCNSWPQHCKAQLLSHFKGIITPRMLIISSLQAAAADAARSLQQLASTLRGASAGSSPKPSPSAAAAAPNSGSGRPKGSRMQGFKPVQVRGSWQSRAAAYKAQPLADG
eukprot:523367-Pelagomonas_calceolata.AAC.3